MPWDQSDYEQAKGIVAAGKEDPETIKGLTARISQYEEDRARGQNAAPANIGRAPQPAIDVPRPEAPKPGPQGYWKPQRPLGVMDFMPEDTGGKLAVWRDLPFDAFREKVVKPQAMQAVQAGEQAKAEIQRFGPQAFSPQDIAARIATIAQGEKARQALTAEPIDSEEQAQVVRSAIAIPGTDPEQLAKLKAGLEVYDNYKQFNDQHFQQAVQERQKDPNAGPIQRMDTLKNDPTTGQPSMLMTVLRYGPEKAKEYIQAGARGAANFATLGALPALNDALVEKVAGRDAVELQRNMAGEHPLAQAAGAGAAALEAPGLLGPGLMRAVYSKALPAVGRYGAALASGAASGAAERLGQDASQEAVDQLSGDPRAVMERGRLEPGRLATSIGGAALGGGLAGLGGQGLADLGGGLANKISRAAIKGTGGRTPFETAEAAGYHFGPMGVTAPDFVKQQNELTRQSGLNGGLPSSWAERFAGRAAQPLARRVDLAEVNARTGMALENEGYFNSVGPQVTRTANLESTMDELASDLKAVNPPLVRRLRTFVGQIDPLLVPKDMGLALKRISDEAEKSAAGSDSQAAEAFKRLQSALMEDMQNLPKGNLPEGWPALRAQHDVRGKQLEEARQLTGAKIPGASLPEELAQVNKNLMDQGKAGFPVAKEAALDRFMPPDLKRESMMLRAANMVEGLGAGRPTGPYPSRAGVLSWLEGKGLTTGYGIGRAVSRDIPKSYPISDKLFTWVNARMPAATMFVPGMDLSRAVQQRLQLEGRPKTFGDLTPEQQQLLTSAVGDQPGAN